MIHVMGGGSQNVLLNQMTAEATGIPVVAGPVEATVLGNALIQLITLGEIENLEQGRQVIAELDKEQRYEPQQTDTWQRAYDRYKQILTDRVNDN